MITQVKIPFIASENAQILPEYVYSLYGVWMTLLRPRRADKLQNSRWINMHLVPGGKNTALLTVNLLTDEAAAWMFPLFRTRREYILTKYNCALTAGEPRTQTFGEDELVTSYLARPKA